MLLGRDWCLNEGEGGRGHTGTELPQPPPRHRSHREGQQQSHPHGKGTSGGWKKPRAMGWFSTRLFTMAANPWPSPQLGPNKVEMSSYDPQTAGDEHSARTPPLCSSPSLAGSRFSFIGFVPCLLFLATRRKGAQKKAWRSSQMAAPGGHCSLGCWRMLSAGWASTEPALPCIRAWGKRPLVPALAVISPLLPY